MPDTIKVFVSYSRQDASYLENDSLLGFLKGLERDNIEFWTDRTIRPGELRDEVIKTTIQNADIALVLVSQGFLDSEYCQDVEIRNFLAHKTHLFPIILSPSDWHRHEWLKSRQFLPSGDQTIEEYFQDSGSRKRLFLQIREQLRERAELIRQDRSSYPPSTQTKWRGSPYPGLFSFNPEQAPIFFGRGREIRQLIERLKNPANRFLAVIGASGSGKSSLVAAGLIPQLGEIIGGPSWLWIRLTPGELNDDPFLALANSIKFKLLPHNQSYEVRKIHDELIDTGNTSSLVQTIIAKQSFGSELLIFIDQFEELFTLVADEYRKPFTILLAKMAETERLRTVITLRADFYQHCLDHPRLAALLRAGSFPLAAPDLPALMEMITSPAAVAGLSFEEGLPGLILRNTGSEPGPLALMAFALTELYDACQPGKTLTHTAYDSFEGVQGAIRKRADTAYKELDDNARNTFGQVFTELVEVDPERGIPTRKRASLAHFNNSPAALRLIGQFAKARLLVCDNPDKKEAVVEVAHEALLTHWPHLKSWIEERFDDFRLRRQLQHAALDWETHGWADAYLWSSERVIEARGMLERIGYQPTDLEQRFLGPIDPARMLEELTDPGTSHERRALIGVRLALIGDPRPGVGLRKDGLPDIAWCTVPGGEVVLEIDLEIEEKWSISPTFKVEPFYISKYLVTWAQYRAFLEDPDGYRNSEWWEGLLDQHQEPGRPFQRYDNHPVENVSWLDAVAFCHWLSQRLGYEIRLPTEWEWQQAATGGEPSNKFPWGATWDSDRANTYESGLNRTTAVGMYPHGASPVPVGTLDMSGNVWEWCLNEYEYPERTDLSGEATRVVRGGSWRFYWHNALAAYRDRDLPDLRNGNLGFRVVCSSPILP